MTQVGSAEVEIRGNLDPLARSLDLGEEQVKRFQASVDKFSDVIERKFSNSTKKASQEANKFHAAVQKMSAGLGLIPGPAGAAAARFSSLLTVVGSLGPVGTAAALGVAALTAGFSASISEAEKFQQIGFKTEAMLKATGYAAGLTGARINELGEDIESTTLATSEDVQKAAQHLITFGNTAGKEFERTIRLAEDLSAATGDSLVGSVEKLGRAFDHPVQAARMFRDIGLHEVVLLEADALKKAGKEAEAHALILDAIQKKVGGTGGAAAGGLAGGYHQLTDAVGDLSRAIGESGPLQFMDGLLRKMAEGARLYTQDITGATGATIKMGKAGVVATEAAKKGAEIAAQQRAADDKRANAIKKATEDAKKAADAAEAKARSEAEALKQLNERRFEAVRLSDEEADNLERLVPSLLKTTLNERQMTKEFQFETQLLHQLSQLHLERGSTQGKALEENLRRQQKMNEALQGELAKRALLKQSRDSIAAVDLDTSTMHLGSVQQDQRKRAQELTQANAELAEGYRLTTKEIQDQAAAYGRAVGAREWASITKDLSLQTDGLNQELAIATKSFSSGTKEAEAFKFGQEALAKITLTFGSVSREQATQVKFLADAYGEAALKLEKLKEQQETSEFLNGALKDDLKGMVLEGKKLGEVFGDMGKRIRDAAFEATLFGEGPLAGLFGTSNKTGGGGLLSGLLGGVAGSGSNSLFGGGGLLASILHGGGSDPGAAPKRHVNVNPRVPVPKFHDGLKADEFLAVLQRGEEVSSRRQVASRGRGGNTMIFNVQTPDANSFMMSKRQIASTMKRSMDRPGT